MYSIFILSLKPVVLIFGVLPFGISEYLLNFLSLNSRLILEMDHPLKLFSLNAEKL
jgi:hypothetical protein